MIKSWGHKGLKKFFETGNTAGIQAKHKIRLRQQLAFLNTAKYPTDLNLPGYKFHRLSGDMQGYYAISVSASWRLIFQFNDGNAVLVDYLNYH